VRPVDRLVRRQRAAGQPERRVPGRAGRLARRGRHAFAISFPILGALIVIRLPRNWFGWVLLAQGAFLGPYVFVQQHAPLVLGRSAAGWSPPGGALASWLGTWTNLPGIVLASTFFLLLFPDGRLPSRRWRPLAWASAVVTVVPAAIVTVQAWPLRGPALID
jgi:hypothetical protein